MAVTEKERREMRKTFTKKTKVLRDVKSTYSKIFLANGGRVQFTFFVAKTSSYMCLYKNKPAIRNIHLEELVSAKVNVLGADRENSLVCKPCRF